MNRRMVPETNSSAVAGSAVHWLVGLGWQRGRWAFGYAFITTIHFDKNGMMSVARDIQLLIVYPQGFLVQLQSFAT